MSLRVLVAGGTGQVGSEVVRAFLDCNTCSEVVMVNRKPANVGDNRRLRQVVLDTSAATFEGEMQKLAASCVALGSLVVAVSCIGIGKGSQQWSEEDIVKLEVGVVGAFARGCHAGGVERFGLLSAAGSSAESSIRYARIMGKKEDTVRETGFRSLAIFRPGIIAGNVHTPKLLAWLGRLIPGSLGTIDQEDIGRAFVEELLQDHHGTRVLGNALMMERSHRLA
jgi:uncharacterized protein YbjT (DUF2867 family)